MRFPNLDSFFTRSTSTRERITAPNASVRNQNISELGAGWNEPKSPPPTATRHRRFRDRLRSQPDPGRVTAPNDNHGLRFVRSKYSQVKRAAPVLSTSAAAASSPATTNGDEERGSLKNLRELVRKSDLFANGEEEVQRVNKLSNVDDRPIPSVRSRKRVVSPSSPRNRFLDEDRGSLKNLKELVRNSNLMANDEEEVQRVHKLPNVVERPASVARQRPKSLRAKSPPPPSSPRNRFLDDDRGSLKDLKEFMKNSDLVADPPVSKPEPTTHSPPPQPIQVPPVRGSRFVPTKNLRPTSSYPRDEFEDEDDRGSLKSLTEFVRKSDLVAGDDANQREWMKGSRFEKKSTSDPLPGRPKLRGDRSRNSRCRSLLGRDEMESNIKNNLISSPGRDKTKKSEEMDDEDDRGSLRSLKVFMAGCDLLSDNGVEESVKSTGTSRRASLRRNGDVKESVTSSGVTPRRSSLRRKNSGAPESVTSIGSTTRRSPLRRNDSGAAKSVTSVGANRRSLRRNDSSEVESVTSVGANRRSLRRNENGRRIRSNLSNDEPPVVKRRLQFRETEVGDDDDRGSLKSLKEFMDQTDLMVDQPKLGKNSSGSRLVRDDIGRVPPAVERRLKAKERNEKLNAPTEPDDNKVEVTKETILDSPVTDGDEEMEEKTDTSTSSPLSDVGSRLSKRSSSRSSYLDERRPRSMTRRPTVPGGPRIPGSPRSPLLSSIDGAGTPITPNFNRFSRIESTSSDTGRSGSGDAASSSDSNDTRNKKSGIGRKNSPRSVVMGGGNSTSIKAAGADLLKAINKPATEREYSGKYCNFYPMFGCFRCRACDRPLYSASAKFDGRAGYPWFDRCYKGAVTAIGVSRRAGLKCSACNAHLGHMVVGEWLSYTNERHSVNSVALSYDSNPCGKLENTLRSNEVVV